jgi:beta-lactamase class A
MTARTAPANQYTRRTLLVLAAAAPLLQASAHLQSGTGPARADTLAQDLFAIEAGTGGRIGVAALNLATGRALFHRGDERFAMCSTFKWLLAGLILNRVERGEEDLQRRIEYTADELATYSPVTERHAGRGGMTIDELCAATIGRSDNTAANLLLASLGGPAGFTERVRRFGDNVTRLDRLEPALNENAPGDPRDTTNPLAMIGLMEHFLFGDALRPDSRNRLRNWMIAADTGLTRLRAGLPDGWTAGDKTGTSNTGVNNDVAFAMPPENGPDAGRGPVLIVSFIDAPDPFSPQVNAAHRAVAESVIQALL